MGGRKKEKEAIVIGKLLKVGMPLEKTIALLGIPKLITVKRGTEPEMDSISIEYLSHGVRIHALAKNPSRGCIFLKNDTLVSAKLFAKNSKLLEYKLLKQ